MLSGVYEELLGIARGGLIWLASVICADVCWLDLFVLGVPRGVRFAVEGVNSVDTL